MGSNKCLEITARLRELLWKVRKRMGTLEFSFKKKSGQEKKNSGQFLTTVVHFEGSYGYSLVCWDTWFLQFAITKEWRNCFVSVNFTVSDNIFRGKAHLCNRLLRILMLNLEAAFNGCWKQSHKIQLPTQKIWIPLNLAQSVVESWAAESLRILGLSGCGVPAVDQALDMCINKYLLSRISMGGEKTNHHGQTLRAPSRPLGFHLGSVT